MTKKYMNKETKEKYICQKCTKSNYYRLYSLGDNSGKSDITIGKEDFLKNYIEMKQEKTILKLNNNIIEIPITRDE